MRCIAAALLVTPAVTLVAPIARAPSQCMASSAAIDVRGAFVMSPYVDMHAIDATPARRRGVADFSSFDGVKHPTHWLISKAELKALKERQAVMPGSAVFHS